MVRLFISVFWLLAAGASVTVSYGQCGGILEPGFAFLSSSRGCAPFTVSIQTLYLSSVPGTQYYINWGDGTPEEVYTQVNATGVIMTHTYPNTSVACGYDVVIDAANGCNPRGSVVPINTQVIVWTNDIASVAPTEFRVCQGFAATVRFTDNSTWNCFPRLTRENNEPRWIQWLYGTGPGANQIAGVQVNALLPAAFPYLDPAPGRNPIYPVAAPGQVSLPLQIPVTTPAEVGREFQVTLKNWNQCNPYDQNLADGNALNPVSGDLVNGDNAARMATARVVIVPAPQPDFLTRLGGPGGPVQTVFCVGDNIYFDNETPGIAGSNFQYAWEFFDNATGVGAPLQASAAANPTYSYATAGLKLIRLSVRDGNAAGNCVAVIERIITISPSLIARIRVTDTAGNGITPDFCQSPAAPFTDFTVRFADVSVGVVTPTTQWRWEFYDPANGLTREEPAGGGFSTNALGPFDQVFTQRGVYRVRLIVRDNVTSCETVDQVWVRVFENPQPQFTATQACEGQPIQFRDLSTLNPLAGDAITLREWDFSYNGTFNPDPAFDNQTDFTRVLGPAATYPVALRVTNSVSGCSQIGVVPVEVLPLPLAAILPNQTSGCSVLPVRFTNVHFFNQTTTIDRYVWEVDEGGGFTSVRTQWAGQPDFRDTLSLSFSNVTTANRIFSVRLRALSAAGCERVSAPVAITVFPGTASGFSSPGYSPFADNCSPQTVGFFVDAATQALNPANYRWEVRDAGGLLASTDTGTTPAFSFTFTNATVSIRDYQVRLITTLTSGCTGDSARLIRIAPTPTSAFTLDTLQFDCNLLRVRLAAVQRGLPEYRWILRENGVVIADNTGTAEVIEYAFTRGAAPLSAAFSLETRNLANCASAVTARSITVPARDALNAAFTVTPLLQVLPNRTVTVTNLSQPGPWQYRWEWGDGNESTAANPGSHTYATFGTYTIRLTVTHNVCVESVVQTIEIQPIPPLVDFDYEPAAGCAPLTVRFTNRSQFADPSTYEWSFGQGQGTSRAIDPTYTYFEPGTYTVTLSASNITGQRVTETKQAIIQVYPVPRAAFEVRPSLVYIPGGVLYTNNLSLNATRFLWDFGDGTTSTEVRPEHRYRSEGFYTLTLEAENELGCRDTARVVNAVRVQTGGQMLIPNAFSPSLSGPTGGQPGAGQNDVFLPLMRGVVAFEMLIFNRWGELLFRSTDPNTGWDGYYRGRLCAQDVYVYKIVASYENGDRFVRTGDVNLIR